MELQWRGLAERAAGSAGNSMKDAAEISGVVNVFKPAGRTSAHYVYRLRPILGVRKIGHAGTLDPFADGVLLACVGRATKLVERLMALPKRYLTTLRLGVTNETFDTERPMMPVAGAAPVERSAIETALMAMTGDVEQVPPRYSAIRLGGRQSYKLARRQDRAARSPQSTAEASEVRSVSEWGGEVRPVARPVRIDAIDVVSCEWPELVLDIRCGRGVYIRAIARDLGEVLGCGAVCTTLRRTAVGPFNAEDGLSLENATRDDVLRAMLSVQEVEAILASTVR